MKKIEIISKETKEVIDSQMCKSSMDATLFAGMYNPKFYEYRVV